MVELGREVEVVDNFERQLEQEDMVSVVLQYDGPAEGLEAEVVGRQGVHLHQSALGELPVRDARWQVDAHRNAAATGGEKG